MWIASKLGFYSIVRKPTPYAEEIFHVRARLRPDLDKLLQATRLHKTIEEWPEADYRYRFFATDADLRHIMSSLATMLDYDNFKSAIGRTPDQKGKLAAYHSVWQQMADLQR